MGELLNYLPEGVSVVAVVSVVVIFLKFQAIRDREYTKRLAEIATTCHSSHETSQRLYQEQIQNISDRFTEESIRTREAITQLHNTITTRF